MYMYNRCYIDTRYKSKSDRYDMFEDTSNCSQIAGPIFPLRDVGGEGKVGGTGILKIHSSK